MMEEQGGGEVKTIVFSGDSDKKTSAYFKKRLEQKKTPYFSYGGKKIDTKRLNQDEYKKPTKTITDLLQTREAILEKLANYDEIDSKDMELLPKNTLISYITFDPEKSIELYRSGGYLRKVAKEYIVLAGKGNKTFSVQRYIYNDRSKSELLYVTRFFGKRNGTKEEKVMIDGGSKEVEKSGSLVKKQQEILEAKNREIEELRAKLASYQKGGKEYISHEKPSIPMNALFISDDEKSTHSRSSQKSHGSHTSHKSNVSHKSSVSLKSKNVSSS
jgi:hypothetical protein